MRAAWQGEEGVRVTAFAEALCWGEEDGGSHIVGSAANRVVRRFLPFWVIAFAEEVAECHAPIIQFDYYTHRRNNGTFL